MVHRGSNGTSRLPSFITLGIGSLAAFLTTVVFLIDVILVAVIRKRVRNATDGDIDLVWGNAVRSSFLPFAYWSLRSFPQMSPVPPMPLKVPAPYPTESEYVAKY